MESSTPFRRTGDEDAGTDIVKDEGHNSPNTFSWRSSARGGRSIAAATCGRLGDLAITLSEIVGRLSISSIPSGITRPCVRSTIVKLEMHRL